VNRTRSVPVTVARSGDTSKVSVSCGRFGSGAAYVAGHGSRSPLAGADGLPVAAVREELGAGAPLPGLGVEQPAASVAAATTNTAASRVLRRIAVTVSTRPAGTAGAGPAAIGS
jgi:hypothetical protein